MSFFKNKVPNSKKEFKIFKYQAKELISIAKKIIAYRKDVLHKHSLLELNLNIENLVLALKNKTPNEQLLEALNCSCKKHGGKIYPQNWFAKQVESILVAAIVAIGIRTFFLQPFKIPTNSMYPTFAGMVDYTYTNENPEPNIIGKAFNFVTKGAVNYKMSAFSDGNLTIPVVAVVNSNTNKVEHLEFDSSLEKGRKYFNLWPTTFRKYTFFTSKSKTPTSIKVPADFSIDNAFFKSVISQENLEKLILEKSKNSSFYSRAGINSFIYRFDIEIPNKTYKLGEDILNFDIITGDMLFVDKVSYNFVKPKVGDPFVFNTKNIPRTEQDVYYIKRLVGQENDTLEIKEPALFRNDKPITGSIAFDANAKKLGEYNGYIYAGNSPYNMEENKKIKIPQKHYFAMGDNSPHSSDSRYWGFVPEKEVVGKALFIFYPFTQRFGVTK